MNMNLPEAYHLALEQLRQYIEGNTVTEGLQAALDGLVLWLDKFALPPSAIPSLKADLEYALANNAGTEVILGLAAALHREIDLVMRLYCNDSGESSSLRFVAGKPVYHYTWVTVLDGHGDALSTLARIRETVSGSIQNIFIFNGLVDALLPDLTDTLVVRLPHALGYAQLFSILPYIVKGRVILFSDNGVCPNEGLLTHMLDQVRDDSLCFLTAAPNDTDLSDMVPAPYFDPCPPWGFQVFPWPLLETVFLPDNFISSMMLVWQAFIEKMNESGITVATYRGQMSVEVQSVFYRSEMVVMADRWRFLQITGHEPLLSVDSSLVSHAVEAFTVCSRALVIAGLHTSLAAALMCRAKDFEVVVNWQLHDGAEEMEEYITKVEGALREGHYGCIIFGIPINLFSGFEQLLRLSAAALMPGGNLWYYDENMFFAGKIGETLADELFYNRPNKYQYSLFFRKRLRDLLFGYGLDLSFERYKPPMDHELGKTAEMLSSLFSRKQSAVSLNLSTKYYFCRAVKRAE